jgi:hypothetical protein
MNIRSFLSNGYGIFITGSRRGKNGRPTHFYGAKQRDYRTFVTAIVRWQLTIGTVLTKVNTEKANIGAAGIIGQTIDQDS